MCKRFHYLRSTHLFLALAVVVHAQVGAAQQIQIQIGGPAAGSQPQPSEPEVGMILADRTLQVNLSRAAELLAEQRYAEGIPLLQEILDSENEIAYPIDTPERKLLRNLRIEAERLVGGMPAAGLQSYELFCDAAARNALEDAVNRFDIGALISTSCRYFHTEAGAEATYLLGTIYLDQGRPFDAALWLERLQEKRPMFTIDRNILALQTAIAWGLADRSDLAIPSLLELKRLTANGKLDLGDHTVDIFDDDDSAVQWLRQFVLARTERERASWQSPLPSGNTPRSSPTSFQPQFDWSVNTSRWQVPVEEAPFSGGVVDVARQIGGLEHDFHKRNIAAIPCSVPLIAGDVALVRTHGALQAYEVASGQRLWKNDGENALEKVRRGDVPPLPGDTGSILDPVLLDRIFENSTFGTMSVSTGFVFVVDDLGFATSPMNRVTGVNPNNQTPHPLATKSYNRLCAFDTTSGELKWSVGGQPAENKLELAGYFFLGPPLPIAHNLYCLAEVNRQIQLLLLDARTGELDWSIPLQGVGTDVTQDEHRGRAGLSPSFADCVLICPTGTGLLVAVDLATRQLMWSYRYRELEQGSQLNRIKLMARMAAMRGQVIVPDASQTGHWADSLPIIADGRLFVTPRDSEELYCLRLNDGTLLWKLPKEERQYLGGVYDGQLLVVGTRHIELLNVVAGKSSWSQSLEISRPSGHGLLVGNRYHVPLSTGAVATVDLDNAKVVSVFEFPDGLIPGNLISANGFVISQGSAAIACFRHPTEREAADAR